MNNTVQKQTVSVHGELKKISKQITLQNEVLATVDELLTKENDAENKKLLMQARNFLNQATGSVDAAKYILTDILNLEASFAALTGAKKTKKKK